MRCFFLLLGNFKFEALECFIGRDSLLHEGVARTKLKINDFSEKHVSEMLEKFVT
jgi:hypothetical protein